MCLLMTRNCFILVLMVLVEGGGAFGASPADERVSGYLAERGFDELLEVQLFDRLEDEHEVLARRAIAERLGGMYLAELAREGLSAEQRQEVLLKGRVLVGMMGLDELLGLRLELLVQVYKEYEQAADLSRIELLSIPARELGVEAMKGVVPELSRIAVMANIRAEQLNRSAARATGDALVGYEKELAEARGVRSRANFFHGWGGYSLGVLSGGLIGDEVLKAFGWVLGFDGTLPVLERVDRDLMEYDHVSRAMLGVSLAKLHNGETGVARVWLTAVEDSDVAPEFAVHFASQRLLEVSLIESDWIASEEQAYFLKNSEPDSLLGVGQARLMVLRTMEQMKEHKKGKGGSEGAMEVAQMGLDRLVELGEIGHILDLRSRFGSLPLLDSGFVSLYTQGLSELADGDSAEGGRGTASYAQASVKLGQALEAADIGRYGAHAGDAALKLAYCQMRLGRAGAAVEVLTRFGELMATEKQREESAWLMILAHDAAVQGGQDQLSEQLTALIGEYLRMYPSTERANTLIVRYAMSAHLAAEDAVGALVIDDVNDPLAVPARRKLIQLLYKNPELVDGDEGLLYGVIVKHARWLWRNEPVEIVNVRDGRERLAVCRIVLGLGIGFGVQDGAVDLGFLIGVLDRADGIVDEELALDTARSELGFRRVQVLLLKGDVERAGEIALSGGGADGGIDESVRPTALLMVYEAAHRRFVLHPSVPFAQAVVRYGRGVMDAVENEDEIDGRRSLVLEGVAKAAEYLYWEMGDETMREYGWVLSRRVFERGVPSALGLVRTAEMAEVYGQDDIAIECWLRLVGQLSGADDLWHRSRYESFRLLKARDPMRAMAAYEQYVVLYPKGSPEPWGAKIGGLFEGGGP